MKSKVKISTAHPALDAGSHKMPHQVRHVIILITILILSACTEANYNRGVEKTNIVDGKQVHKPNCPDWSSTSWGSNHMNYDSSNFGCSTVNNMGEMVLDKKDLVVGKSAKGTLASRSGLAVTKYQSGATIGSTDSSSSGQ